MLGNLGPSGCQGADHLQVQMKLSVSLLANLLILVPALPGINAADMRDFGELGLPYMDLIPPHLLENYLSLVGVCEPNEIEGIIRLDLERLGILPPQNAVPRNNSSSARRNPRRTPRSQDNGAPYNRNTVIQPNQFQIPQFQFPQIPQQQHIPQFQAPQNQAPQNMSDWIDDDIPMEMIQQLIQSEAAQPQAQPGFRPQQPFRAPNPNDYFDGDGIPAHLLQEMGRPIHNGHQQHQPQGFQDYNEVDAVGNPVEPPRDITEHVPGLTAAEAALNGVYHGPNPLTSESEAPLQHFLSNPLFLNSIYSFLVDTDNAVNNIPTERIIKVLIAALLNERLDVFDYIVGIVKISFLSGPDYRHLLKLVTSPGREPVYLKAFLTGCTPVLVEEVGKRMNEWNFGLHQTFVDCCGSLISKDLGRHLLPTVNVSDALAQYWLSDYGNEPIVFDTINPEGQEKPDIIETYADDDVQIVCLMSQSGQSLNLQHLKDPQRLRTYLARLSKVSGIQRRFSCAYLDKKTNMLTVLCSPQTNGPAIVVLHHTEDGFYAEDEAMNATLFAPFEPSVLNNQSAQFGLRVASCQLKPGDLVFGLPESFVSNCALGMPSFITSQLSFVGDLISAGDMQKALRQLIKETDSCHQITLCVVPWTQEMLAEKAESDRQLSPHHSNSSGSNSPAIETQVARVVDEDIPEDYEDDSGVELIAYDDDNEEYNSADYQFDDEEMQ